MRAVDSTTTIGLRAGDGQRASGERLWSGQRWDASCVSPVSGSAPHPITAGKTSHAAWSRGEELIGDELESGGVRHQGRLRIRSYLVNRVLGQARAAAALEGEGGGITAAHLGCTGVAFPRGEEGSVFTSRTNGR